MKKIIGAVFSAVLLGTFAGCATKPTGDARDTAAFKQNEEMGLPSWVGQQFKSRYNKNGYYWRGPVDEEGYFASGEAKYADVKSSTTAADLDGKAQIAFYIKQEVNAIAQQESVAAGADGESSQELKDFQSAVASVKIAGIIRADRFIGDDGTVYVLMFVPDSEIKKALPANSEFARRVVEKYLGSFADDGSGSEGAPSAN
ncbi:hypothetical protein [Treponema saccharophilum]|uniref:Lipoprotein n=1 Tax=Treponema saccharophilum DSM 2985 TaxID=907348 RepID=H7EIE9_9SPIR|nr:hypothetical protein [Treponema saccharophilum]EIC02600.1 hypothetical protein TresaDRAFT_1880 [Treponema saccharophilum DSM 2985]BDC96165.1 hypothetical protein TRSA_12640 [Treponema saccharophilum]